MIITGTASTVLGHMKLYFVKRTVYEKKTFFKIEMFTIT
jgi:hypothetical protein